MKRDKTIVCKATGEKLWVDDRTYEIAWELNESYHRVFGSYRVNFTQKGLYGNVQKYFFKELGEQREEFTVIRNPIGIQLDVPETVFRAVETLHNHLRRVNPMAACFEIKFSAKGECSSAEKVN